MIENRQAKARQSPRQSVLQKRVGFLSTRRLYWLSAIVACVLVAVTSVGATLTSSKPSTNKTTPATPSANAISPRPLADPHRFALTNTGESMATTSTTVITQSDNSSLDSVWCDGESDCVAVGNDGSGSALIESSTDGGATFTRDTAPSAASALSSISCYGASTCVAVGGNTLVYSSDGGDTWSTSTGSNTSSDISGVTCSSSSDCVAVGMMPQAALPDGAIILDSSDGGEFWSQASVPTWVPGMGSVTCTSTSTCIAVGGSVLVSEDGGQTWSNETVSGGLQALSSVTCSSSDACMAIGPNSAGIGHADAEAMGASTGDGGQTWSSTTLPAGTSTAWAASCSDSFCMVVGPQGTAQDDPLAETSSDAGADWSPAPSATSASNLLGVDCVSDSQCVVVGQGSNGAAAAVYSGNGWNKSEVSI
jgi:photosystem II stability/assembly factor-like uncharacterized protein